MSVMEGLDRMVRGLVGVKYMMHYNSVGEDGLIRKVDSIMVDVSTKIDGIIRLLMEGCNGYDTRVIDAIESKMNVDDWIDSIVSHTGEREILSIVSSDVPSPSGGSVEFMSRQSLEKAIKNFETDGSSMTSSIYTSPIKRKGGLLFDHYQRSLHSFFRPYVADNTPTIVPDVPNSTPLGTKTARRTRDMKEVKHIVDLGGRHYFVIDENDRCTYEEYSPYDGSTLLTEKSKESSNKLIKFDLRDSRKTSFIFINKHNNIVQYTVDMSVIDTIFTNNPDISIKNRVELVNISIADEARIIDTKRNSIHIFSIDGKMISIESNSTMHIYSIDYYSGEVVYMKTVDKKIYGYTMDGIQSIGSVGSGYMSVGNDIGRKKYCVCVYNDMLDMVMSGEYDCSGRMIDCLMYGWECMNIIITVDEDRCIHYHVMYGGTIRKIKGYYDHIDTMKKDVMGKKKVDPYCNGYQFVNDYLMPPHMFAQIINPQPPIGLGRRRRRDQY